MLGAQFNSARIRVLYGLFMTQKPYFLIKGANEKQEGSARWQIFGLVLGPRWSMFFCLLILRPSCTGMQCISFSACYSWLNRQFTAHCLFGRPLPIHSAVVSGNGNKFSRWRQTYKKERTSITTVLEIFRIFATFLTLLCSHYPVPLR